MLINIIDISGIKANSIFEFVDTNGNLISSSIPNENVIFASCKFLGENSLVALGDSMIICFDKDKKVKWQKPLQKKVYSFCTTLDRYAVLAIEQDKKTSNFISNNSDILILNNKGTEVFKFTVNDEVRNLESYDGVIAVNTGREVYFINQKAKLLGKFSTKKDILGVRFINKDEAIIITKGSIIVYHK